MAFIAWTDIESFHNVKKNTKKYSEILNGNAIVTYRAKIKLHGTCGGIQIHSDGRVIAQSRNQELINGEDNAGFAKWVESNKDKWASIADDTDEEYIIFGEWIGPSIQSGVACNKITKKSFAVFAARHLNIEDDTLIIQPYILQDLVKNIPDTYVLPWHNIALEVNWNNSSEQLTSNVNIINDWVMEVEKNDPWVENVFGVAGTGEGLVFYPCSKEHLGLKSFKNLVFKAKGEKHKNIKTASPAQVNPEMAVGINEFVDMVLSQSRLEQGASFVGSKDGSICFDIKLIGKFIAWIIFDVKKETKDELEISNLTWDQVNKTITNVSRSWYLEKCKE